MGILNDYSNSVFSDMSYRSGDFCLSSVNKEELARYNIDIKVKDFKEIVKKSSNFKTILTGGRCSYRRTKVYNYNDFKYLAKIK